MILPKRQLPLHQRSLLRKIDGPVYVPAEVYKLLRPEAVAALKKYNTEAINKIDKKKGIYVTDIADHEPVLSEDTPPEEQPDRPNPGLHQQPTPLRGRYE